MSLKHLGFVLIIMVTWGFNFVFIRLGLKELSPLLLCSLRFLLAAIPLVFFLKRPKCSLGILILYGVVMFALQFSLLFTGMKLGMSAAIASLLMQTQVFFTMIIGTFYLKEKPRLWKWIGALISFSGIAYVAYHTNGELSLAGLIFTLMGACSWGCGNIISKKIGKVEPLALVSWGSLFAAPFIIAVTLLLEGPSQSIQSITHISGTTLLALGFIVYFSTHLAYGLWSYLLSIHPASQMAPFTLLVPIFGFIGSAIMLGEQLQLWKILAAVLVISGICFNILEPQIRKVLRLKA